MTDDQVKGYVLLIAEQLGCRNEETTRRVSCWDKPFMIQLLERKIATLKDSTQIASVQEIISIIHKHE